MKYLLVYIVSSDALSTFTDTVLPGTMIEVDRFDTLEAANAEYKRMKIQGQFLILPYYEVEK